jgi:uncharacterized protein YcbK (DUF882 family)
MQHDDSLDNPLRRRALTSLLGLSALALAPASLAAVASRPERALAFHNLHTGESVRTTYWAEGELVADGLAEINQVLRDHRSDEVYPIDTGLLDLLNALTNRVDTSKPFEVISGYRSPATNANLRKNTGGVARNSLHMQGKAIDIRLPGYDLSRLRKAALALRAGGVGYYPKSGFIHVDTGRVRSW